MTLASRCATEFDSRTQSRGRDYDGALAVQIVDFHDWGALADVTGSSSYSVSIDWTDEQDGILRAVCTCPRYSDGHLCKHIWATLLTIDRDCGDDSFPGPALNVEHSYDRMPWHEDNEDDQYDEEPAGMLDRIIQMLPGLSEPGPTRRAGRDNKKPDWTQPFRELHRHTFTEQMADSWEEFGRRNKRAWYVLDVSESVARSTLMIDLFYQEPKKNGEYGKAKRLDFDENMANDFVDPADRELLCQLLAGSQEEDLQGRYYHYRGYRRGTSTIQLPQALHGFLLPKLADTGRFLWMLDTSQPIEKDQQLAWDPSPWQYRMNVTADDQAQKWELCGELFRGDEVLTLDTIMCAWGSEFGGIALTETHLRCFASGIPTAWIGWMSRHSKLQVPYEHRDSFLKLLWAAPGLPPIQWPENLALEQVTEPPIPCLRVHESKGSYHQRDVLAADISFIYGGKEINPAETVSGLPEPLDADAPIVKVHLRDMECERDRIGEVFKFPTVTRDRYRQEEGRLYFKKRILGDLVDQLLAAGWHVEAEGKQFRSAGDFRIDVQSGIDWFDLDATIDFGGITAQLPDLLNAVRKGEKFVALGDGSRGILPEEWLNKYTGLAELGSATDGKKVRFKRSQALLLDALLAEQKNLRVDTTFQEFRERLQSFRGVAAKDAPSSFEGTLREYQRDGLGWFQFLDDLGVGGCLADDMGLGKTIQVLALLEAQRTCRLKKGEERRPSLAVVPKSLIFNWIDEAQRFTPHLKVLNYTGTGRKELVDQLNEANMILTTYGTLRRDIAELKDRRFNFVILDEAQAIKNASSQAAKACLLLQADHRLALTGTPIENHLGELWSLFEFLNPGMLGRSRAFASVCKNVRTDNGSALSELSRAIAPFVLRRTKEQVLTELPEKTEQTLFCELPPKERKAYDELRDYYRTKLSKVIDSKGLQQSKIHVLEALLRLRQAACHPGLINSDKRNGSSAKLDILLEQLEEIIGEGHKALVFSQFTSLLAIVRHRLDKRSIQYEYLDGQTRKRKQVVDRFQQSDGCNVFLISLKAGGQGLNLTEADYVYILDPWWNPAVEMQAIDRAHRIGQTQPVFAYRIIARDTVEEKVLELQDGKRELANAIITANDSLIRKLTAEDLQRILS